MNYAGVLAGGVGKRMGRTDLPKQFLMLGNKPILIHTLEQFLICNDIDKIILAVPQNWKSYSEDLVKKYCDSKKIDIICGGETRNDTILNICNHIKNTYEFNEYDVILTHDSVRPFITQRIIKENITECKNADAVDTVIPAADTIVEAKDKKRISNIPIRDYMFLGQTPQTFKVQTFIDVYNALSDEEKDILTDACKMFVIKEKDVKIVKGESYNLKITTPYDLKLASLMLGVETKND
ncbi:MAG: 2-C-methyl-D-erythritol 4-phosphate cytidylyltransferase [Clostridia bacterium]|nr:2-C-methyl-D-erythritol 4-phosphate cytidylyltransferase [Clostridia bacterium]